MPIRTISACWVSGTTVNTLAQASAISSSRPAQPSGLRTKRETAVIGRLPAVRTRRGADGAADAWGAAGAGADDGVGSLLGASDGSVTLALGASTIVLPDLPSTASIMS